MSKEQTPLGTHLRELRERKDISLRELAKNIGCSPAFLSDVELGRRFPTDEMFARIAKALGTSVTALKEHDTRPPVEDIRKRTQSDPQYAYLLRRVLESGKSSKELLDIVEEIERRRGKK